MNLFIVMLLQLKFLKLHSPAAISLQDNALTVIFLFWSNFFCCNSCVKGSYCKWKLGCSTFVFCTLSGRWGAVVMVYGVILSKPGHRSGAISWLPRALFNSCLFMVLGLDYILAFPSLKLHWDMQELQEVCREMGVPEGTAGEEDRPAQAHRGLCPLPTRREK